MPLWKIYTFEVWEKNLFAVAVENIRTITIKKLTRIIKIAIEFVF